MQNILDKLRDFKKGIVLLGDLNGLLSQGELENEVLAALKENVIKVRLTPEQIKDLEVNYSEKVQELFQMDIPEKDRKYSFITVEENELISKNSLFGNLICEKRPLRIIFLISMKALHTQSEEIKFLILGNMDNFLLGKISSEDKELLEKDASSEKVYL